jgi:predicted  nucleic acid-binding Zn-ribbon protein
MDDRIPSDDRTPEELIAQLTAVQTDGTARAAMLLEALAGKAAAERERADELAAALALTKAELQAFRAQCEGNIDAARHEAARLRRELSEAQETLRSAVAGEATLREEMSNMRSHYQEVVDSQTLQLLELTRELTTRAPALVRARRAVAAMTRSSDADDSLSFDAIEAALAASPL